MKQAKEKAPRMAATMQSAKDNYTQVQDTGECLESHALKQIIGYFYQLNARGIKQLVDYAEIAAFNPKKPKGCDSLPGKEMVTCEK